MCLGFTMGIFATLHNVVTARYFVNRRLLALGLGQTGSAMGTLVLSPLLQYLIDFYGWRGGMLLLGGLTLNSAAACSVFRPIRLKTDQVQPEDSSPSEACKTLWVSGKRILKLPRLWLVCAIWLTVFGSWRAYLRFLVPYSMEVLDITSMAASFALSIYSVVGMLSRVVFGIVGDRKGVNVVWFLITTHLMTAVILATVWFIKDYAGLLANCVAHGISTGAIHTMYLPVMVGVVGEDNLTWGYSITGFIYSVLGSATIPLIGKSG